MNNRANVAILVILAHLLFFGLTPSAFAQNIISKTSTQQMEEIFKTEGYSFDVDSDGDLIWRLEGFRTLLIIASNKESVQFRVAFSDGNATLEKVNDWNRTKKYSRTYLDNDGDPVLELDIDLEGGVTRGRIVSFLKTCRTSLNAWLKEVVR